jgi:hypothetical protein
MSEYEESQLPNGSIEYVLRSKNYTGPIAIDTTEFFKKNQRHPTDEELARIVNDRRKLREERV